MSGFRIPTIQWGLEFRTFEYRIHLKTERFNIRFSNHPNHSKNELFTIRKPNDGQPRSLKKLFYETVQASGHSKSEHFRSDFEWSIKQNGRISLGRFILKGKKLYKTTQANHVRIWNGWDLNGTTLDYPNTELVRYSSPHCILMLTCSRKTLFMNYKT